MTSKENSRNTAKELINLRRELHKHPEPAWVEYRTSTIIADLLFDFGYDVFVGKAVCQTDSRMGVPTKEFLNKQYDRAVSTGVNQKWLKQMKGGQTGVVGVLKSGKPGPVIAIRFDIDSLNITESNANTHIPQKENFRSTYEGKMHACGHDGHTAIGLGLAKTLINSKKTYMGKFVYFFSGHIALQSLQLGEIVLAVDGFLATTKIDVVFKGKASHAGANPEVGKNALLAAASSSLSLHAIPRHGSGKTRINVGELRAGSERNVTPDYATLKIETRGETTEINNYMRDETIRIIENTANIYDVTCEWDIVGEAPGATSYHAFMLQFEKEIKAIDGVHNVVKSKSLNASEDAVYMINKVQSDGGNASYLLFGPPPPIPAGHHESLFDFDERVLRIGVDTFFTLITKCMKKENHND